MRRTNILLVGLLCYCVLITGCQHNQQKINSFTSDLDTLVVKTAKQRGFGPFLGGLGSLGFRNLKDSFHYSLRVPHYLRDIKRAQLKTDFRAENPSYIDIIQGIRNDEKIFIVDQNNNKDLTDDSVRLLTEIKWNTEEDLIDIMYQMNKDSEVNNSWIKMGKKNGGVLYGRSEHLMAEFEIDDKPYQVGIMDTWNAMSFTYSRDSEIALISNDRVKKDTLGIRDLIKTGEFVKLGDVYYRFDSISRSGDQIFLVKETDFDSKIGTQVGMKAPKFEGITTSGDTISSEMLSGKPKIIGNSCGCGGDVKSTDAYYQISQAYQDEAYVLRLDAHIEDDSITEGIHFDMENVFNRSFYNNYRGVYCSRICYVVGFDDRIIDKFMITDWKQNIIKL